MLQAAWKKIAYARVSQGMGRIYTRLRREDKFTAGFLETGLTCFLRRHFFGFMPDSYSPGLFIGRIGNYLFEQS